MNQSFSGIGDRPNTHFAPSVTKCVEKMVAGVREERIDESGKKESPATGEHNMDTFILNFMLIFAFCYLKNSNY